MRLIDLEAKAKRENLRPFNTPFLSLSSLVESSYLASKTLSLSHLFMAITLPDQLVPGALPKLFKLWLIRFGSASTLSFSQWSNPVPTRVELCGRDAKPCGILPEVAPACPSYYRLLPVFLSPAVGATRFTNVLHHPVNYISTLFYKYNNWTVTTNTD